MKKATLVIDFDDTLATTTSKIKITPLYGKSFELTPAQYVTYQKKEGDKFDFSDFDQLLNPKPIPRYVNLLKRAIKHPSIQKVVILTARGHTKPIAKFLASQGITNGVFIAALGSGDPDAKVKYIERHMQSGHERLLFIDDSKHNVNAVEQLKSKYPNHTLIVHQVVEKQHHVSKKIHASVKTLRRRKDISKLKVRNPTTNRDILVTTALGYDKSTPAYNAAKTFIGKLYGRQS